MTKQRNSLRPGQAGFQGVESDFAWACHSLTLDSDESFCIKRRKTVTVNSWRLQMEHKTSLIRQRPIPAKKIPRLREVFLDSGCLERLLNYLCSKISVVSTEKGFDF